MQNVHAAFAAQPSPAHDTPDTEIAAATKRLHGIANLLVATNDAFGNIAARLHGAQPSVSGTAGENGPASIGDMGELLEAIARLERVCGATSDLVGQFSRL